MTTSIDRRIADELGVRERQVTAAVELLDGGATVPFIARYRKEATGMLDDAQLRTLEERLRYLRELEERRTAILESIRSQGKLDEALEAQVMAADSKARLEDIYLPYKPKRRTKAQIAREAGLEPLADALLDDPSNDPQTIAAAFVDADKGVADVAAALDGARSILVERFAEDADLIGDLREQMWSRGHVASKVREGKEEAGAKFSDYFDFAEPFAKLPSHRILAMFRGEKEGVLDLSLEPDEPVDPLAPVVQTDYERRIADRFGIADQGRPGDRWLGRDRALGLAHPDPGPPRRRTCGCGSGRRPRTRPSGSSPPTCATCCSPHRPAAAPRWAWTRACAPASRSPWSTPPARSSPPRRSTRTSRAGAGTSRSPCSPALAQQHNVELIAIGNGTASRETDKLAGELIKLHPKANLTKIVVSEAGASVYSASAYASAELPELDVSLRGAVSIARRLQDPLAELVKIDPKSIGVGQYQHDLSEVKLSRSLDAVVEDCVNGVGVDVNTASAPLLTRVSGIGGTLAESIVMHRDSNGPFRSRSALKEVPRLGPKAFEQCAGFLRIRGGDDPLDASSVHPEAYPVVRRILAATGTDLPALIGNSTPLRALKPTEFVDDKFGLPTVTDILTELDKPGRDPRPAFKTATFADGVDKLNDLSPGMLLEGVVTNVAAFGAFVDIGVHQDGLVHVSAMSKTFVKDPRDVVKPGDIVRVKVLEVDIPRKRISLTLRLDDEATGPRERGQGGGRRDGAAAGAGGGGQARGGSGAGGQRRCRRSGSRRRWRSGAVAGGQGRGGGGGQGRGAGGGRGGSGGGQSRGGSSSSSGANSGGGALADALRRAGLIDGAGEPKRR